MDRSQNQRKMKLVKILEILRRETDELHPLTTSDCAANWRRSAFRATGKYCIRISPCLTRRGMRS